MALTPEGKVKQKLLRIIQEHGTEPVPYTFFPQTGGYGRSGIPDLIGCWKGRFFAIECKAPGKAENTTPLQQREMDKIREAGGIAFVYDGTMPYIDLINKLEGKE
jgi:Holliday junction resolvase